MLPKNWILNPQDISTAVVAVFGRVPDPGAEHWTTQEKYRETMMMLVENDWRERCTLDVPFPYHVDYIVSLWLSFRKLPMARRSRIIETLDA